MTGKNDSSLPEVPDLFGPAPDEAPPRFARPTEKEALPTVNADPFELDSATGAAELNASPGELDLLDFDAPPPPGQGSQAAVPAAGATVGASPEIDLPGFGDFDPFDSSLEAGLTGGLTADAVGGMQLAEARPSEPERPWPSGVTPPREEMAIDPVEVALLSGFGPAPSGLPGAPWYTVRVLVGRRQLKPQIARAEAALATAESLRDDALVALLEAVTPELERSDRHARLLSEARDFARLAEERERALGRASAELSTHLGEFGARLETLEAERLLRAQEREQAALTEEQAASALRRLEASAKRIEIEKRSVLDVARQRIGPDGGALPADLNARLQALEANAGTLEPELDRARTAHRQAEAQRLEIDRSLRQLDVQRKRIEHEKRSFSSKNQAQIDTRNAGVVEARNQERTALVAAAQRLLEMRGEVVIPGEHLDAVRNADFDVERAATEAEKIRRAFDACDPDALRKGRGALAALGALVVVLLLLGALL